MSDIDDFSETLSSFDFWRLCDELTVVQAAMLLAGQDPASHQEYVEGWEPENRPDGYEAAKAAISRALLRDLVEGELIPQYESDINGNNLGDIPGTIDVEKSTVDVASLKNWLIQRGVSRGFFFPLAEVTPDFLDPRHPRYSPKLAASVSAWYAVDDADLKGKSAKQALEKWLRENGARFNLSDEEGKPNEKGIDECAKVANWQYRGGAPRTPDR